MKKTILDRIQTLAGDISLAKGESLAEDLCSISFKTVLYNKSIDTLGVIQTIKNRLMD